MYVVINKEYVPLAAAAIILSIEEQELITANHTVDNIGDVIAINYSSSNNSRSIGDTFTEAMEDLEWERDYLNKSYYNY